MNKFLAMLLMVVFIHPALAQEPLSIEQFCQRLPAYSPSADVNYKPGVDAEGRAVVPADINTPIDTSLGVITVPVTVDLAQRAGLGLPGDVEMDSVVAVLDVYPDGRVDYNGQDITDNATYICKDRRDER